MKRHFLFDVGGPSEGNGGGGVPAGTAVENQLKGQADAAQIAAWKLSFPTGIYYIANNTDIAYFREPSRHDVNKAYSNASDDKPLAGLEEFGRLTFIGGSDAILKDDLMFLGAHPILKFKMGGKTAVLGNL